MHASNGLVDFVDHIAALAYFVLIPSALIGLLIRSTRRVCGIALAVASAVIGLDVWLWSVVTVHNLWGTIAAIIGILLAGVGVVLMALVATAFHRDWLTFGYLLINIVIIFVCRFASNFMRESAARSSYLAGREIQ